MKRFSACLFVVILCLYAAAAGYSSPSEPTVSGVVTTFAGNAPLTYGLADDGTGPAASFGAPIGVAVDASGNVFVADTQNNMIRKITPDGVVSTLAGSRKEGRADGLGAVASFNNPQGIAVDFNSTIYVADTNNNLIRRISTDGDVTTLAGSGKQGHEDGVGAAASFSLPCAVAVDSIGNLYVTDGGGIIRKVSSDGVVTTFAGSGKPGHADGKGASASFHFPGGVAVDSSGDVLVCDTGNNTIRRISRDGEVTTLAGSGKRGKTDGQAAAASFDGPLGIAVDTAGSIYIGDSEGGTIRKIGPDGLVSTLVGTGAGMLRPGGISLDASGSIYVADTYHSVVRKIAPDGGVTILAGALKWGYVDGPAATALFNSPEGIAADSSGNLYVADSVNQRIRKITPNGEVTTLAGTGEEGHANGFSSSATFQFPGGLAVDSTGNLYVADYFNQRIRKISASGEVTTLAGSGKEGHADGRGSVASFSRPSGVAVDSSGIVYVADSMNELIRKITPDGEVTTLAGSGKDGRADGRGRAASFYYPQEIAVDSTGNLYVADTGNSLVRKITPTGMVTTLAGKGYRGTADGRGAAAYFYDPQAVAVDSSGYVYVAEADNLIRRVSPDGVVTTLAGSGSKGHADGAGAAASFNRPTGIALGPSGIFYITDTDNNTIRTMRLITVAAPPQPAQAAQTPPSAQAPQEVAPVPAAPAAAPVQQGPVSAGEIVTVEGGTFTMGSPAAETGRSGDEVQHQVTIFSFQIGKYDVTQELYQAVMGGNPSHFKGDPSLLPVEAVSWFDAIVFCNKLSERNGLQKVYAINGTTVMADWTANGYRLPTEAEWEYAARGGQKGLAEYHPYAGSDSVDNAGWYSQNSGKMSHPVGQKAPNALGLYDMSGNVYQWCWDWYGRYPSDPQKDPRGAPTGTWRIYRGGGWINTAGLLRAASRGKNTPRSVIFILGFRLARNGAG
jgi:formylglycine-generating enzyme required for sulfatase activity